MTDDKRVSEVLDDFQRRGLYGFERSNLEKSLSTSPAAVGKALNRLAAKGRVKRIRRDFHTILPVEYSRQGMIPVDWFLDDLMRSMGLPTYYLGLQSAAALYGAGHQQIQQVQVVIPRQERAIERPGLSVRFFCKQDFDSTPLQSHKGHGGMLPVSTPEATALDLVRYERQIGGLDAVITILAELSESLNPEKLAAAAAKSELAPIQRLGWLLDELDHSPLADELHATLLTRAPLPRTRLEPSGPLSGDTGNRWKIIQNATPQSDL